MTAALAAFIGMFAAFGLGTMIGFFIRNGEVERLKAHIAPFDRDGDGRIGGSAKKS